MESLCFGLSREGPNEHLLSQAKPRMFFGHNNTSDCESLLSMHPSCQKSVAARFVQLNSKRPHLYSYKILTSVSQCIGQARWSQLGNTATLVWSSRLWKCGRQDSHFTAVAAADVQPRGRLDVLATHRASTCRRSHKSGQFLLHRHQMIALLKSFDN